MVKIRDMFGVEHDAELVGNPDAPYLEYEYKVIERKYNSLPDDKKEDVTFLKNNPLQDLRKCILEYVDNSDLTKSELDIICS